MMMMMMIIIIVNNDINTTTTIITRTVTLVISFKHLNVSYLKKQVNPNDNFFINTK